ncbi:unnamed protein product, partial [Rotaria socialis]
DEMNNIEYNYDPRYLIEPIQGNQPPETIATSSSHYAPLATNDNQRYPLNNYSTGSPSRVGGVNLIRQDSYITAARSTNQNEQGNFVSLHDFGQLDFFFNPETPILRHKVPQYGRTPETSEQELKQRRTSYLIATDQRIASNRENYLPADFVRTNKNENYSYDVDPEQQQKLRNAPHPQTQAIKKLKMFFGEGTPQVAHALDHRPSSTINQSKSNAYFDDSTTNLRESILLTTLADNLEASKEGILYCKTVLKEGRRAPDRSWRGALFLGKEKKYGLLIPLSCDSFPISLLNADVELATPDLQSLAEWLEVIKENCILSQTEPDNQQLIINNQEKPQRKSTSSLPPIAPNHHNNSEQDLTCPTEDSNKLSPSNGRKSKSSHRSPSLKRSPSLRFRKSQKASITQPTQSISSLSGINSPSNVSPRRSFVKSIVKKGLRTLKSSSSLLTSQMSGQIYDESKVRSKV